MATYFGTDINESATIVLPANAAITGARGIALAISGGKVVKPAAGANCVGISIMETDDDIEAGQDIDIQIKDIGKWVAGGVISVGDELATDADGKAVAAKSGDFIIGTALSAATAAGAWIKFQMTKSGYKA